MRWWENIFAIATTNRLCGRPPIPLSSLNGALLFLLSRLNSLPLDQALDPNSISTSRAAALQTHCSRPANRDTVKRSGTNDHYYCWEMYANFCGRERGR